MQKIEFIIQKFIKFDYSQCVGYIIMHHNAYGYSITSLMIWYKEFGFSFIER